MISYVSQLNAAMAQLHKKCNFANFTLIFFFFELNSDNKTKKSDISFICFRNVAFQSARCLNMHPSRTMKMNKNINLTPVLEHAELIEPFDLSQNAFF